MISVFEIVAVLIFEHFFLCFLTHSAGVWAVEYIDCISAEGLDSSDEKGNIWNYLTVYNKWLIVNRPIPIKLVKSVSRVQKIWTQTHLQMLSTKCV